MLPDTEQNKFDRDVLPTAVRCLANASFAAFRAAIQAALPQGTWLEPDPSDTDAADPGPPPEGALQIRCVRRKCVKSVKRMTAKVEEAQGKASKSKDKHNKQKRPKKQDSLRFR